MKTYFERTPPWTAREKTDDTAISCGGSGPARKKKEVRVPVVGRKIGRRRTQREVPLWRSRRDYDDSHTHWDIT